MDQFNSCEAILFSSDGQYFTFPVLSAHSFSCMVRPCAIPCTAHDQVSFILNELLEADDPFFFSIQPYAKSSRAIYPLFIQDASSRGLHGLCMRSGPSTLQNFNDNPLDRRRSWTEGLEISSKRSRNFGWIQIFLRYESLLLAC